MKEDRLSTITATPARAALLLFFYINSIVMNQPLARNAGVRAVVRVRWNCQTA